MPDNVDRETHPTDQIPYEAPELFELGSAANLILGSEAEKGESSNDGGKCY